jgi:transposase
LLAQRRAQHGDVAEAIDLAQDFGRLVRQRQGAQLDAWLARVAKSPIVALQRFAKGLADDYDAVKAGLTLPWSNGPVEGPITRVKRLKRQMCGRASLTLLERRFVLAPERMREPVPHLQEPSEGQAQPAAA